MDLLSRIPKIKSVIEKNEDKINNETTTRYVLIDPILRYLEWNLDDPNQVRYEEGTGGRWDYQLGDRLLIEAKKLNGLKTSDEKQLINYLRSNNIEHGVLTDGNVWQKWTVNAHGENQNFTTRVTTSTLDNIYDNLNKLRKGIIMTTITPIDNSESGIDNVKKSPKKAIVSDFKVPKKLPVQLFCKDNPPILCKHWITILEGVATYLIDNNIINKSDCPIQSSSKTAILNTNKKHQTGSLMKYPKQIKPGFYLNTNLNSKGVISNTKKIIDYSGLSLDDFKIKPLEQSSASIIKQNDCNTPLLEFQTSGKLPAKILYPDESSAVCTAWFHILSHTAAYLVEKNYITKTNCPTFGIKHPTVTPNTPLFNPQYYLHMKNGFYLYRKLNKKCIIKTTLKLLKYAKLNPNDFIMCAITKTDDSGSK